MYILYKTVVKTFVVQGVLHRGYPEYVECGRTEYRSEAMHHAHKDKGHSYTYIEERVSA